MAVVRDLYEGQEAAKVISRLMLVMGVAPILAPTVGSAVLVAGSWRWVFGLLATFGIALLVFAATSLAESLPAQRRRPATVAQTLRTYGSVFSDGPFVALAVATGFGFGVIFSYIAGSSFVLQEQYSLDNQEFGLAFAVSALALIGGSQLTPLLLGRFDSTLIATSALVVMVAAGAALLLLQSTTTVGLVGFLVPVLVMLACGSVVIPNTTALALARHGQSAGTAAAVVGALQFGLGSLLAPVVGLLGNDASAVAQVMTTSASLALLVLIAAARRAMQSTLHPRTSPRSSGPAARMHTEQN